MSRGFKASQKTGFGNKADDEGKKSMHAGQDYNENEESAAEDGVTNIGRSEEATEGKDGSLKSVETTTEKTEGGFTKKLGGRVETQGEYL